MLLVLTYDGISGKRQALLNGTMVINQSNDTGSILSTNHPLSIGGKPTPDSNWGGVQTNYSEFIVLENVLSTNQHLELEGYCPTNGICKATPDNHEYKSSPPVRS